jgi:F0F1-type ATP synthase membrane subunit b/b'
MAQNSKDAWNQVGERFASFGRHLSDHYKEAGSEQNATDSQRKLEEAARQIGNQLDRAFSALDGTLRDAEAKKDLKDAVGAIGSAVTATIDDAGNVIRRRGGSGEAWESPERPDDEPPTPM